MSMLIPSMLSEVEKLNTTIVTNKGELIMEGLLLNQYQNSTNLKEYMMAFVSEMDYLYKEIQEVYLGRFLALAVGKQLDVIGVILNQSRSVTLNSIWFGFQNATTAHDGMADENTPSDGGLFKSENLTQEITPLSDSVYRRVLLMIALLSTRDSCDINLVYSSVITLLGRVPSSISLVDLGNRRTELNLPSGEVTDSEVLLIEVMEPYFMPMGVPLNINRI